MFERGKVQVVEKRAVQFELDLAHALLALDFLVDRRGCGGLERLAIDAELAAGFAASNAAMLSMVSTGAAGGGLRHRVFLYFENMLLSFL